jgi:hypothetical protein
MITGSLSVSVVPLLEPRVAVGGSDSASETPKTGVRA